MKLCESKIFRLKPSVESTIKYYDRDVISLTGGRILVANDALNEDEIVEAILFAESESDWEEVDRLYKLLFEIHDHEEKRAA